MLSAKKNVFKFKLKKIYKFLFLTVSIQSLVGNFNMVSHRMKMKKKLCLYSPPNWLSLNRLKDVLETIDPNSKLSNHYTFVTAAFKN